MSRWCSFRAVGHEQPNFRVCGSVSGLVTMEDVIETLLGLEIMDESDDVSDLQLLARKSWEGRAKKLGIIEDNNPPE